ncbi:MAG: RrF2 family transcriptional regulator [Syntrophotaleaceae bacterium]
MRISTKAQYAVRAMARLHIASSGSPVTSKSIAEKEDISPAFLEQIFVKLRRAQLVESIRGPGGGYVLGRPAQEIRIHEIIESVEQTLVPVGCMDEQGRCNCGEQCVTHAIWEGLAQRVRNFLSSITLADLAKDAGKNISLSVQGNLEGNS